MKTKTAHKVNEPKVTCLPIELATGALFSQALLVFSGRVDEARLCTELILKLKNQPIPTEDEFLKLAESLNWQSPELFDFLMAGPKEIAALKHRPTGEGFTLYYRALLNPLASAPTIDKVKEIK